MEEKSKDLLNGDHSFKMWFSLMYKNFFFQLFLIAIFAIALVALLYDEEKDFRFYLAIGIPALAAIIIAYKGFFQFWNDMKNGRSR